MAAANVGFVVLEKQNLQERLILQGKSKRGVSFLLNSKTGATGPRILRAKRIINHEM
jgi:hypothetical protein